MDGQLVNSDFIIWHNPAITTPGLVDCGLCVVLFKEPCCLRLCLIPEWPESLHYLQLEAAWTRVSTVYLCSIMFVFSKLLNTLASLYVTETAWNCRIKILIRIFVVVVVVKKLKANNFNFNQVPDDNNSKIVNTNKLT